MPCHPRFEALQRQNEGLHRFGGLRLVVDLEAGVCETADEFRLRFAGAIHEAFVRALLSDRIDLETLEKIMRIIAGRVLPISGYM